MHRLRRFAAQRTQNDVSCSESRRIDPEAFLVEPAAPEWEAFRRHYPTCAECSAEVARWTGLEAALRASGEPHPSDERLLAYARHPEELSIDARREVVAHLQGCGACRDALVAVRSFRVAQALGREDAAPPLAFRVPEASAESEEEAAQLGAARVSYRAPSGDAVRRGAAFRPPRYALAASLLLAVLLVPAGLLLWRAWPGERATAPVVAESAPPTAAPAAEPAERLARQVAPTAEPADRLARQAAPAAEPAAKAATAPPEPAASAPAARLAGREVARPAPAAPLPERHATPEAGRPLAEAAPPPAAEPRSAYLPAEWRRNAALVVAMLDAEPLSYRSGRDAPGRIGGQLRGAAASAPELVALVPPRVGLTQRESPALYWYLAQPSEVPIQLRVSDPERVEPLFEQTLKPPVAAGIHATELAPHGVKLAEGRSYRWFVALAKPGERPQDQPFSGAVIERAPALPGAERGLRDPASLTPTAAADLLRELAEGGRWYDALDLLSRLIALAPDEPGLRRQRAALLAQAGF